MVIVVSLGGNALNRSIKLSDIAKKLYKLAKNERIVVTHGNAPQVGELADVEHKRMALLTAQTEAEVGIQIEEALIEAQGGRTEPKVEVVLTKVLIDKNDAAFRNPTKPIGRFYTKKEALELKRKGVIIKHLIKGYRRVVASPKPMSILNIESIRYLLKSGYIVIAGGGGGIPVFREGKRLRFAEAVVDKDYTSCLLAKAVSAKSLFLVTNVDGAFLDFKTKRERLIGRTNPAELREYLSRGHFEEGSMKPKIEACVDFVSSTGGIAAIGNISRIEELLRLKNCTVVEP